MSKIERAIIMAAGTGSRMQPVTFDIPKPLIKVNGTRMIDSVIEALHQNGIMEIYVVAGYLKEQFFDWAALRGDVTVIENPYYDKCNNISSLFVARDHICNTIILDGDQIIYNPEILKAEVERSGYGAIWTDGETDEWLMKVDQNNTVVSCSRTGGKQGWQLFSVSRWNKEDGLKLKAFLEEEFLQKQNRQIYWDDVAMFCHFDQFELTVYPMQKSDIVEIDNYDELVALDHSYADYKTNGVN